MPLVELDPRLALLPASELAALLIAVNEAHQSAAKGEVMVAGNRYQWQISLHKPFEQSSAVLTIVPAPSEPSMGQSFTP